MYNRQLKKEEAKQWAKVWGENAPYKPSGKETQVGVCSDAGEQIREKLKHYGNLRFQKVSVKTTFEDTPLKVHHDVTFVYNPKTLEWAILNSKSPHRLYNVFSKEEVKKIFKTVKEELT